MGRLTLTVYAKDYDFLSPLATGDVVAEGFELNLIRDTASGLQRLMQDPESGAGETSFSRQLLRLANDDHSFIAIPFMVTRAFRQRCFYVRRGSGMTGFSDLAGKRIGTNEWPATGNTWSRAVLREQGVDLDSITWWVGSVDGGPGKGPPGKLPDQISVAPPGRGLLAMLLDDELDGLMVPLPPPGFYEPNSPVVRLFPDFRRAEQEYYRHSGIFPIHHITVMRKAIFDHDPQIAVNLYNALCESRRVWFERRRNLADTSPWAQQEYEEMAALFGAGYLPDGAEPNMHVTQALINDQVAQGLTDRRIDAQSVFAQFEEARMAGMVRA